MVKMYTVGNAISKIRIANAEMEHSLNAITGKMYDEYTLKTLMKKHILRLMQIQCDVDSLVDELEHGVD